MAVTLTIETIVTGGFGLARSPEGVVLCRGVIPGEIIEIEKMTRRRGVLWAEQYRLIESSPERIASECRFFPDCGGCDFHHVTYEAELKYKTGIVKDTLRRFVGEDIPVEAVETILADEQEKSGNVPLHGGNVRLHGLGYRNTIRMQGAAGALGYCKKGSNEIVDIDDCIIATPAVRDEVRKRKSNTTRQLPKSLTIRAGSDGGVSSIETSRRGGHEAMRIEGGPLQMKLAGRDYQVSVQSFFQVNIAAAEHIIADMRDVLPPGKRLLDLFAGVGTFALSLCDRYDSVLGCEISRSAVKDFRHNAMGVSNVKAVEWDAAKGIAHARWLKPVLSTSDVVILDPPRTGLPDRLIRDLAHASPARASRMAYVSCDPATFARDLKKLFSASWRLERPVRLYDMFPRTAHVEMMAVLV